MTCKDCIHYDVCHYHIDEETDMTITECGRFINKADFVEVVRCEKCSWATERKEDNELFKYQCRNTIACGKPRRENDFCSYGERKDT